MVLGTVPISNDSLSSSLVSPWQNLQQPQFSGTPSFFEQTSKTNHKFIIKPTVQEEALGCCTGLCFGCPKTKLNRLKGVATKVMQPQCITSYLRKCTNKDRNKCIIPIMSLFLMLPTRLSLLMLLIMETCNVSQVWFVFSFT